MQNYESIFTERGRRYDHAMQRFPHARDEEFLQLVSRAALRGAELVADVPAGGGYLQRFLPATCTWLGHEPCASFTSHGEASALSEELLPLPWEDQTIDAVLSLAGVHHIDDKTPLFREAYRITRKGGHFVLSDVEVDSAVAEFLDGYVGRFNSTGHSGIYLGKHTRDELLKAEWVVHSSEIVEFHWRFENVEDLEAFCNELFDIQNVEVGQTAEAVSEILGISTFGPQGIGMNWSLRTLVCEKAT